MSDSILKNDGWESIRPKVNEVCEFREIAGDFGNPLEIFREALHNAYDWNATEFSINITVEEISESLVLELTDNGDGMSRDVLTNNFWNLGESASRNNPKSIGEKGHGTKIYLRSDQVIVQTSDGKDSYESICDGPFKTLNSGAVHTPKIRRCQEVFDKGTKIKIVGYNHNQRNLMRQDVIKDYLYWFTVLGTIENQFTGRTVREIKVKLKALDWDNDPEELKMGHPFAKENKSINTLFEEYGENAADHYVKKFVKENQTLPSKPEIKYDAVIYYEGDEAKREYNTMIRARTRRDYGTYKVADRYGLWLCKDFVPIQRVNEWITNFGSGSNSFGLLHGFINCQKLKLTANRGTIANTNADVIGELKECVQRFVQEINLDLYKHDVMTLQNWQNEAHALKIEAAQFDKRKESVTCKKYFEMSGRTFLAPRNEAELYGLFISLYTLNPDHFNFEPLDYDASLGIDLLARNKSKNRITDSEFWYVELKYQLGATVFNHSFQNIRYIVCWEIAPGKKDGSKMESTIDGEQRILHIVTSDNGKRTYYLDNDTASFKIGVICLKDYIEKELNLTLKEP